MSGEEEDELCEYERRRLARMRENRDLMRTLGEQKNFVFICVCEYVLLSFSFVIKAFVARAPIAFLFSSVFVFLLVQYLISLCSFVLFSRN